MTRGPALGNLAFALLLLGFGVAYHAASGAIPSNALEDPVGAKGFPRLLGLAIIGLAVLLVLQAAVALRRSTPGTEGIGATLRRHAPTAWILATIVVFLSLFDALGYVLAIALLLAAVFLQMGMRPGPGPVAVAVLGAVAFRVVFGEILGVRFPAGLLALAG